MMETSSKSVLESRFQLVAVLQLILMRMQLCSCWKNIGHYTKVVCSLQPGWDFRGLAWLQACLYMERDAAHDAWVQDNKKTGASVDPPPCLYHSSSRCWSIHAPLLWPERSALPWDVWVLQHRTVNPPVSDGYWLGIHVLPPAQEKTAQASALSSSPSPYSPAGPHTDMTAYSILCRIQAQLLAFSLFSSTNISPPPLFIWQYDSPSLHLLFDTFFYSSHHLFFLSAPLSFSYLSLSSLGHTVDVITNRRGSLETHAVVVCHRQSC